MRDPVNNNCTWHWIGVHGKEGKKIYTFIILKIEVPPVIIKSTLGVKHWRTLKWSQQHFNVIKEPFSFLAFEVLCCAQNQIISLTARICLKSFGWI